MDSDSLHPMRQPCKYCWNENGRIVTKGGQDVLYCSACNRHQYNVPKHESGRKVRTLQTTHAAIKPKQRHRIIERANGVCEKCRRRPTSDVGLTVGHVVSVKDGHELELPDEILNSDDNLIAECPECNGPANGTVPLHIYIAILRARA